MSNTMTLQRTIRFLLVEDNPSDMRKLVLGLRACVDELEIDKATCGKEALQFAARCDKRYDIIVVDYDLPDMQGTMLLSELKKLNYRKVAIGYTRFHEHLDNMEQACAMKAFCKDNRGAFLTYIESVAKKLKAS